MSNQSKENYLL